MFRLIVVLTVVAFVAGAPAPQEQPPPPAQGPPPAPTLPSADPQLLQDCKKQKEVCESQYGSLNNGASSAPQQLAPVYQPVQGGANNAKFCEQQYNGCIQGSNYSKPPPAGGANPPPAQPTP